MEETNGVLRLEKEKTLSTIADLRSQHEEIEGLMKACRENFSAKPKGQHLASQIRHLQTEIELLGESIENKQGQVDSIVSEIKASESEVAAILS